MNEIQTTPANVRDTPKEKKTNVGSPNGIRTTVKLTSNNIEVHASCERKYNMITDINSIRR